MIQYAPYGSKEFNRFIQSTLENIAKSFDFLFSRDELIALVLGGGYGRLEGGVLRTEGNERLYNDLDFFVVSRDIPSWKQSQISRMLKNLHYELSDELGVEVDFSDLKSVSSLAKTPITLMWYDLLCGHQVIWGNKHALQNLPRWKAEDLGISEALKLMLNRAMGLYFAKNYLDGSDPEKQADFINRNIHKAYQAISESILITEGNYHHLILERQQLIQKQDLSPYSSHESLKGLIDTAIEFKLQPEIPRWDTNEFRERLAEAICIFEEVYYAIWAAYFGVDVLDLKSYHNLLSSHKDQQSSVMSIAKNFALNVRDCGINPAQFAEYIKYPRYRLFYALPWLLFGSAETPESIGRVLGWPGTNDRASLEKRYVELWQRYN